MKEQTVEGWVVFEEKKDKKYWINFHSASTWGRLRCNPMETHRQIVYEQSNNTDASETKKEKQSARQQLSTKLMLNPM